MDLRYLHIEGDPQRLKEFFAALNEARTIVASCNLGDIEEYEVPSEEAQTDCQQDTEKPAEEKAGEENAG